MCVVQSGSLTVYLILQKATGQSGFIIRHIKQHQFKAHLIMTKHGARTLAISNCISLLAGCVVENMEMIFMQVITKRQGTKCIANQSEQ